MGDVSHLAPNEALPLGAWPKLFPRNDFHAFTARRRKWLYPQFLVTLSEFQTSRHSHTPCSRSSRTTRRYGTTLPRTPANWPTSLPWAEGRLLYKNKNRKIKIKIKRGFYFKRFQSRTQISWSCLLWTKMSKLLIYTYFFPASVSAPVNPLDNSFQNPFQVALLPRLSIFLLDFFGFSLNQFYLTGRNQPFSPSSHFFFSFLNDKANMNVQKKYILKKETWKV